MIGLTCCCLTAELESSDEEGSEYSDVDAALELGETATEVIDGQEYIVKNVQGDPTDGDRSDCTRNFLAAAADNKKGMFALFDKTGVFVAVCKHGVLIIYCDMICSGEL